MIKSWVIVEMTTGKAMYETFDEELAKQICLESCKVLPFLKYVAELNRSIKKQSLQILWDALHDYQHHMQEGHDVFLNAKDQEKWDEICEAMAFVHEALNIPHEEID